VDSAEIETLVNELETRVDRLRALYEQYFMGIERMPPSVPHKDVERRIQVLRKEQIRNTGVRFRFQMIIQRYNTYQTHWQRICRQIEEGTYKRDLLRAQRRKPIIEAEIMSSRPPPPPEEPKPELIPEEAPTKKVALADIDSLSLDDFADLDRVLNAPVENLPVPPKPAAPAPPRPQWRKIEKPAAPPAAAQPPQPAAPPPAAQAKPAPPPLPKKPPPPVPTAAAKPAPPAPAPAAPRSPADIPDARMRQLYSQYVQTRRAQNESTAAITYDAMAKSLRESSAKLREKHGKAVDFEVAVKDGKTILRPVVKPK
jgi:hypothetical protein